MFHSNYHRDPLLISVVNTGPADSSGSPEPLSLDDVKTYLRIFDDTQDDVLTAFISAARQYCEDFTRRCIVPTTYQLTMDRFPGVAGIIELPNPPTTAVSSVTYTDTNGDFQTLAPDDPTYGYTVDLTSTPARIAPSPNCVWPTAQIDLIGAVNLYVSAGYSDVPQGILTAMKLIIGNWYENWAADGERNPHGVPPVVATLLGTFRWGSYT